MSGKIPFKTARTAIWIVAAVAAVGLALASARAPKPPAPADPGASAEAAPPDISSIPAEAPRARALAKVLSHLDAMPRDEKNLPDVLQRILRERRGVRARPFADAGQCKARCYNPCVKGYFPRSLAECARTATNCDEMIACRRDVNEKNSGESRRNARGDGRRPLEGKCGRRRF
ncbi:MAG: hypothetical protein M5R36_06110 [Deltaproteobacteria bacterium]|nr:hypothetical protein [Deltaproteobacteria bacterium]